MRKWFIVFGLLVISVLISSPVLAETSEGVTVTATGYICGAPGGLTLTYISDYEVGISWAKGDDAENTMVRAAVGRLPKSRTDGYLVYYGDGTSTSDTGVSLDESAEVHYIAWSQNASGIWEEVGTSDFIGGYGMLAIAVSMIILGLTVLAFVRKEGMLYAVSIIAWMFFTLFMFNQNWPAENTYLPTAIALFGGSMVIVCTVMLLNHYIISRRYIPPTHSEIQLAHRKRVIGITRRRKKQWWEE